MIVCEVVKLSEAATPNNRSYNMRENGIYFIAVVQIRIGMLKPSRITFSAFEHEFGYCELDCSIFPMVKREDVPWMFLDTPWLSD